MLLVPGLGLVVGAEVVGLVGTSVSCADVGDVVGSCVGSSAGDIKGPWVGTSVQSSAKSRLFLDPTVDEGSEVVT